MYSGCCTFVLYDLYNMNVWIVRQVAKVFFRILIFVSFVKSYFWEMNVQKIIKKYQRRKRALAKLKKEKWRFSSSNRKACIRCRPRRRTSFQCSRCSSAICDKHSFLLCYGCRDQLILWIFLTQQRSFSGPTIITVNVAGLINLYSQRYQIFVTIAKITKCTEIHTSGHIWLPNVV